MTKIKFLRTACSFLVALLLGLGGVPVARAQAPLNLRITNNSNFQNSRVYLMFGGITAGFDATATVNGTPNTALVLGTSYALSQISDIKLTSFRGEGSLFPSEAPLCRHRPERHGIRISTTRPYPITTRDGIKSKSPMQPDCQAAEPISRRRIFLAFPFRSIHTQPQIPILQ